MLRWFANALDSSVGRKALMALTGLFLFVFLIGHLAGNLTLFFDADGTAFNAYVEKIKSFGALVYVAEVGLAALFLAHIALGIRLTLQNREARRQKYVVRATHGRETPASGSMIVTGLVVGGFLIVHLFDFRFDDGFTEDPAALVKETLHGPLRALIYLLAMVALALHLSHGIRSAFQSLGASHPRWNVVLERTGTALAVLIGLGFAAFPVYFLFLWDGASS